MAKLDTNVIDFSPIFLFDFDGTDVCLFFPPYFSLEKMKEVVDLIFVLFFPLRGLGFSLSLSGKIAWVLENCTIPPFPPFPY